MVPKRQAIRCSGFYEQHEEEPGPGWGSCQWRRSSGNVVPSRKAIASLGQRASSSQLTEAACISSETLTLSNEILLLSPNERQPCNVSSQQSMLYPGSSQDAFENVVSRCLLFLLILKMLTRETESEACPCPHSEDESHGVGEVWRWKPALLSPLVTKAKASC